MTSDSQLWPQYPDYIWLVAQWAAKQISFLCVYVGVYMT